MLMSRRNCVSLVVMVVVSLASAGVVLSGVLTAPAGPEVAVECVACRGTGTQNMVCSFCNGTGRDSSGKMKCFNCFGKGFPRCVLCQGTGQR